MIRKRQKLATPIQMRFPTVYSGGGRLGTVDTEVSTDQNHPRSPGCPKAPAFHWQDMTLRAQSHDWGFLPLNHSWGLTCFVMGWWCQLLPRIMKWECEWALGETWVSLLCLCSPMPWFSCHLWRGPLMSPVSTLPGPLCFLIGLSCHSKSSVRSMQSILINL